MKILYVRNDSGKEYISTHMITEPKSQIMVLIG